MAPWIGWFRRIVSIAFIVVIAFLGLSGRPDPFRRPLRIICLGDDWVASALPYYLWQALRAQIPAVVVFNEGRYSHTASDLLQYVKSEYDRLARLRPDIVFIAVGTRDIQAKPTQRHLFVNHLRFLVRLTRTWLNSEGQPAVVILTTLPPNVLPDGSPAPVSFQRVIRGYINVWIRDIAIEERVPVADVDALDETIAGVQQPARRMALAWYRAMMPYIGLRALPVWE